ncbi:hypothetical protein CAPTEDRAFT_196512 [Capitella teleta]|uniref:Uncharacterized protein n=1 Tax=Capitella teleta TaxID=283909 RepID=R7V4M7_CAPTE|nr:hypothetical protein CAPTEDRAFT_196512 [Capitella teleta]|eukprot:ELU13422.1 hypothetical protein CAPTEDRAFT_196512 [Capitella teleta]
MEENPKEGEENESDISRSSQNCNGNNSEEQDKGSGKGADDLYQQLMKEVDQQQDGEFWQDKQPKQKVQTPHIEPINDIVQDGEEATFPTARGFLPSKAQERSSGVEEEIDSRNNTNDTNEQHKSIDEMFRAEHQTSDVTASVSSRRMPNNKVAPLSRIQPNEDAVKPSKSRGKAKIKCAKNYRQIAAEKARKGIKGAVDVAKNVVKEVLPEPMQDIMEDAKDEGETPKKEKTGNETRSSEVVENEISETEKKTTKKNKSKIKTSKTYKQIIAEKSKKVAKLATKTAHAKAMQYAGAYVPQPMMKKLNNKLADHGFISPTYSRMSTESPYSPYYSPKRRPWSGAKKKSKIKTIHRREGTKKDDEDGDVWSDEELEIEELADNADDTEHEVKNDDSREKKDNVTKATENSAKEEDVSKETSDTVKNDVERKQRRERKSRCVSTSKRVHERNPDDLRYNKRRQRKPEKKKVEMGGLKMGGGDNKGNSVTAMIEGASKCTSVGGIAKTMAPKLAQGILGNKRMKKAWGSTSKKCSCCKCCSSCGSHCDTIVKIFMSVVSMTVVAYDVAMAWIAFSGFYRFEGSSPLTILFGIVCSIASLLMLLEFRNAIMTCLVSVIKVKKLQKTGEGSSFRQKVINEEYWQEAVQLLELFLGDLPIAIILALTITFGSCELYIATFKRGIVGKLSLYAVFISATWKAIMACVQFCLSKPLRRNEEGKRRYGWAVFRILRPLLALTVLFFAVYIILTINGVYINLTGRDEARWIKLWHGLQSSDPYIYF